MKNDISLINKYHSNEPRSVLCPENIYASFIHGVSNNSLYQSSVNDFLENLESMFERNPN